MFWPSLVFLLPLASATIHPASGWHIDGPVSFNAIYGCDRGYGRGAIKLYEGASANLTFRSSAARTRYILDCMLPLGTMNAMFRVQLDDEGISTHYTTSADNDSFQCTPIADETAIGGTDHVLKVWVPLQGLNAELTLIGADITDEGATTSGGDVPGQPTSFVTTSRTQLQPSSPSSNTWTDTVPSPTDTTPTDGMRRKLSNGAIVGIALGAVVSVVLPLFFILFCRCRRRRAACDKTTMAYDRPSTAGVRSEKSNRLYATLGADEARSNDTPADGTFPESTANTNKVIVNSSSPPSSSSSSWLTFAPPESSAGPQEEPEIRELYAAMRTAGFTTQSLFDQLRNRPPEESATPHAATALPRYE